MKISGTRMMSLPILLALSVPVGATSYAGITIETEQATLIPDFVNAPPKLKMVF